MIDRITEKAPGFRPKVAVLLGSGLGGFADEVTPVATIPYADLPGFPQPTVGGHAGRLVLGHVGRRCWSRCCRAARTITNAAASTRWRVGSVQWPSWGARFCCRPMPLVVFVWNMPPGSLMAVTDHINFTGINPLFGAVPDNRRFVDMVDAYDPALVKRLLSLARAANILCHEGVYMFFSGPSFETPAEIRAAVTLGASAVGMSTAPETILARHAGMKVAAVPPLTNYAAGLVPGELAHEQTLAIAEKASGSMFRLLRAFIEGLA